MQSFDHTFHEFPEGRWWIAWVDYVLAEPGQPRRVHVTLAKIWNDRASAIDLRLTETEVKVVRMVVSALPLFAVGDVIHNKRLVRVGATSQAQSVCDLERGGVTVRFAFDAGAIPRPEGVALSTRRLGTDARDGRRPTLSIREYPFPVTRNCLCLVIKDGARTFLIPAAELLRSLVMPFSEPLGSLFDSDLPLVLEAMVEPPSGPPARQGFFRLDLKEGYDGRHAPFIANLIEDYDAVGASAAARIHYSLSHPDPDLSSRTPAGVVPAGCSLLPVVFPFGRGSVSLEAKCFELKDERFLVAKIVGGRWPERPPLEVSVARSDGELGTPPPPGQAWAGRRRDLRAGDDAATHVDGSPGVGSAPVELAVEPLHWNGLPAVVVSARVTRSRSSERRFVPDREERSGTAVGQSRPDGELAPATASHVAEAAVDRFAETHAMLMRLAVAGRIVAVEPVLPADPQRSATRGPLPVWVWPGRKGWHVLGSASGPDRPRSLLVLRVEVKPGRFVHWFCVEPSHTNSSSALLVAFREPHAFGAITKVVDEISKRSGRIGDPQGFAAANGGHTGAKFRHALTGPASGSGGASGTAGTAGHLNEDRALPILTSLVP